MARVLRRAARPRSAPARRARRGPSRRARRSRAARTAAVSRPEAEEMSVDSSCAAATGGGSRRDGGERVAMTLPGLQVIIGRHGPAGPPGGSRSAGETARRRRRPCCRRSRRRRPRDVRAVDRDRRVGREVRVVEPVADSVLDPQPPAAEPIPADVVQHAGLHRDERRALGGEEVAALVEARVGRGSCRSRGRSARRRRPGRRSPVAVSFCVGARGRPAGSSVKPPGGGASMPVGVIPSPESVGVPSLGGERHDRRVELGGVARGLAAAVAGAAVRSAPPGAPGALRRRPSRGRWRPPRRSRAGSPCPRAGRASPRSGGCAARPRSRGRRRPSARRGARRRRRSRSRGSRTARPAASETAAPATTRFVTVPPNVPVAWPCAAVGERARATRVGRHERRPAG